MQASWKQDTVNLEQICPKVNGAHFIQFCFQNVTCLQINCFQAAATTGTYLGKLMQPHSVHSLVAKYLLCKQ